MKGLENDVRNVKTLDELVKLVGNAIYFKSDLREVGIGDFIREKYKEFEVYEGVVVTYGYDCGMDLYYVHFWNEGRLTECMVRNEFDYYALVSAFEKFDLRYPVVLSSNGVLKQDDVELSLMMH